MKIHELNGTTVCILGCGKEGKAMLAALETYAPQASITLADANPAFTHEKYEVRSGPHYLDGIASFDVIVQSPGIPPCPALSAVREKCTSGTQLFLDTIQDTGAITIGVTGSKGKSTTASLIHAILKEGGKESILLGNIGEPSISHIADITNETIVVLEMSSYQLMLLTRSPAVAVITSFFPEHLDYHGSLHAYREAKTNITRFQSAADHVFYRGGSPECEEIARHSAGTTHPYHPHDAPLRIEDTHLIGEHNLANIAGAFLVATHMGIPKEVCIRAIKAFRGLPHRLQDIGMHHGIRWIDDAISTTPESSVAALKAIGTDVSTIILGGQDRGLDFSVLATELTRYDHMNVILFPGSGPRIREAIIAREHGGVRMTDATSMEEAVAIAKRETESGKICLLSTASPSYGMFKNFEEKGDRFQACVLS